MKTDLQPHLRCCREDAAEYAILPGDPGRVERVMEFLENSRVIAHNREFKTAAGFYRGIKVMVVSTGIGGPSTCIAVEELRNIGVKTMIRIGSCGALQRGIKNGELVIATGAVRNDGTSKTYIENGYPAVPDFDVLKAVIESAGNNDFKFHYGLIRSHDSFYTDDEDKTDEFWSKKGILAADMESAPLFVIGALRGIRTASILNVVVEKEGQLEESINSYVDFEGITAIGERNEIITALEAIAYLNKNK